MKHGTFVVFLALFGMMFLDVRSVEAATYSVAGNAGMAGVTVSAGGKSASTDNSGNYSISGLNGGTYSVIASKSGCIASPASLSISVGPNATGKNFSVACSFSIQGNAGISGAVVTAGSKSATSDSTGAYTISGAAAGTYTLAPSKPGCTFSPSSISVAVGPNVSGKNFSPSCSYTVSGNVGSSGATVSVGSKSTTSDASNNFSLALSPGTYSLTPSKAGCSFSPASISVVIGSASVSGKNFTSVCTFSISGNAGTSGVTISAGAKSVSTDSNGAYSITGLFAGTYLVSASKSGCTFATTISVAVGPDASGKNFAPSCTFSISGSVSMPGVTVTAASKSATSDNSGAYTITGLSSGTFTVTPSKTGCTFSPATVSVTASASVSGKNFTPSCTFSISGNVGVPGATLTAGSKSATGDAGGSYTISGVNSGNVTLTPSKAGCTFSPTSMSLSVSGNVSGKNFTPSCSQESDWAVPVGSDFGQRRGCWDDALLGPLSKKRAESCSNGFSTAKIRVLPDSSGSKILIEFIPQAAGSADQVYFYRMTLPWAAKVTDIKIINGQPVTQKKESETLTVIGDELKDKVLGTLAFPLKLFFADTKVAGDPPYLTYATDSGLLQRYYPYTTFDGRFQRTFPGMLTEIVISMATSYGDLSSLLQSSPASFYVGGTPQNELLVEAFKP